MYTPTRILKGHQICEQFPPKIVFLYHDQEVYDFRGA